jgi:RND family efflux transporter MFP subunit
MRAFAILAALLVLVGGAVAWRVRAKGAEATAQAEQRKARSSSAPSVAVGKVERRDIVKSFEGVGTIEAPTHVKLAAKVSGRIAMLTVEEGDHVAAGQVLVRLDAPELEAQVRSQLAQVAESRAKLAQAELGQNPADVSAGSSVRQQEAAVASARADNEQVRKTVQAQTAAAQASLSDAQAKINNATAALGGAEAGVRSAQANLANARTRHSRVADLFKQGFIAAQDVDDARTTQDVQSGAVEVATGQLNVARAQLRSAHAIAESAKQNAEIVAGKGQADIAASDAKLQQATAMLDTARANKALPTAYRRSVEAARAALAADEAGLRNARAMLANSVLVAPVSGRITAKLMDPGSMATVGAPILEIQAVKTVWATAAVPEEAAVRIRPGQPGAVTVDAWPGRDFKGQVTQVNAASDIASRQVTVRVALDNADGALQAGMFAKVKLVTQRLTQVIVAPREALQRTKAGPALAVVGQEMHVRMVPVQTGAADAAGIEVKGDVAAGDKVVTMAGGPIKDGQTVRLGGKRPAKGGKRPAKGGAR